MLITIFTPTYNRAQFLPKLYFSLLKQTFSNFEWLIVDDGSTDDTKEIIKNWQNEKKIDIIYFKQKNGGKHRAINRGLQEAKGELFFIVDSDDVLPEDSLSVICKNNKRITGDIVGIVGRKQYPDSSKIGGDFPVTEFISDHIEKTYINAIKGDLAEVVKTEVLRQCKFPDYNGEKFCAEGVMWNQLAAKGLKLYFFDESIYTAEYLEDGLSANSIINRRKSPRYAMQSYSDLVKDKRLPIKIRIRTYINYWRFSFFVKSSFINQWNSINRSLLGLLCYPLGWIFKIKDDRGIAKRSTKKN